MTYSGDPVVSRAFPGQYQLAEVLTVRKLSLPIGHMPVAPRNLEQDSLIQHR